MERRQEMKTVIAHTCIYAWGGQVGRNTAVESAVEDEKKKSNFT